ncbi:MAG TPA: phytanoyl-CoA dioxygenase family protein [Planctomycetota bacterium]|nr:phytanoyl-CoA dioxygenase family protein [Planctomycetota bacterium]
MGLTAAQVQEFRDNGVLIAKNVLTEADLKPLIDDTNDFIDQKARQLKAEGKITDLAEGHPFETRIARLFQQSPEIVNGLDIMQHRGKRTFEFIHNKNLLDAVESLIGPEITCSPIQHLRAKVPASCGNGKYELVGWHQDLSVTWEEADVSDIVTCWIPLVDATVERGCMEVMPGLSKFGYIEHGMDTCIKPELVQQDKAIPAICPRGGVVFMSKLCPHRGLPNVSDTVRWTIDLRYQVTGTPTGRPFYPDFPVRTKRSDVKLISHEEWCARWIKGIEDAKNEIWHRPKKQAAMAAKM